MPAIEQQHGQGSDVHNKTVGPPDSRKGRSCSMVEFWSYLDVFCLMDPSNAGVVRRKEFHAALKASGTSTEFIRVIQKAGLIQRFRSSAQDVTLDEFIKLMLPQTLPTDLECMHRWADLHRAHQLYVGRKFCYSEDELQHLFRFLSEDDCQTVLASSLVQADILTCDEVPANFSREDSRLGFDDFSDLVKTAKGVHQVSEKTPGLKSLIVPLK